MIKTKPTCRPAEPGAPGRSFPLLKTFAVVFSLVVLAAGGMARADELEDAYLRLLGVVQQADSLEAGGKNDQALSKYQEAQKGFLDLRKNNRDWQSSMVGYRLSYVTERIAALSEKPAGAEGSATADKKKGTPETVRKASSGPVKLLEAGAEPRTVLRFQPKPGDKQPFAMILKLEMESKVGEMQSPAVKLPGIKFQAEMDIKDVSADGAITYAMVMGEPSIVEDSASDPQLVSAVKASFNGMKGFSANGSISSRGIPKNTGVKLPSGVDPQARQAMDQIRDALANCMAPFPEEAVGAGAKWEVKAPLKSQGMSIDQTATYELVSVEGNQITTKATIAQRAANQKIENPAMQGLKLDLTKMTGKGSGKIVTSLDKIMPVQGSFDSQTDATMNINMGGQKQTASMKMGIKLEIKGK